MISFAEFVSTRIYDYVTVDAGVGRQCVDLVEDYIAAVHGLAHIPGNAIDLYANADHGHWIKVGNLPANFPAPGDVVTWRQTPALGIGPDGHCAVVLLADVNYLVTLDQDWPPGARVEVVVHSYVGVFGWLRVRP